MLTPAPNLDLPPQSIILEYLESSSIYPNLKRKATNIIGALAKRAVKIEKIALYYSKTIKEH